MIGKNRRKQVNLLKLKLFKTKMDSNQGDHGTTLNWTQRTNPVITLPSK